MVIDKKEIVKEVKVVKETPNVPKEVKPTAKELMKAKINSYFAGYCRITMDDIKEIYELL